MGGIIQKTLYAGPCDGEVVKIHEDNMRIKPRITLEWNGETVVYGLDNHGEFVWLPNPDDPKVARGYFVCDDDGNVISEEPTKEDALRRLDELDGDSERWKRRR